MYRRSGRRLVRTEARLGASVPMIWPRWLSPRSSNDRGSIRPTSKKYILAVQTRLVRTTAMWRAWPLCLRACLPLWPRSLSIGCVPRVSPPSTRPPERSRPTRETCTSQGELSRCPGRLGQCLNRNTLFSGAISRPTIRPLAGAFPTLFSRSDIGTTAWGKPPKISIKSVRSIARRKTHLPSKVMPAQLPRSIQADLERKLSR